MSVISYFFVTPIALVLILQAFAEARVPRAKFPEKPFWERKESTLERMYSERAIFVSVKTKDLTKPKPPNDEQLQILGVGVVNQPRKVSFSKMSDFAGWSKIHEVIQASQWTPNTNRLFLHLKAFKYHAKMIFEVETLRSEKDDFIYMVVREGSFKGMRVALKMKDAKSRKTEISMTALHEFDTLPMPRFFIEFGLEVIFQKIAEKMRTHIEAS